MTRILVERPAMPSRADEVRELLEGVQRLVIPFIRSADKGLSVNEPKGHTNREAKCFNGLSKDGICSNEASRGDRCTEICSRSECVKFGCARGAMPDVEETASGNTFHGDSVNGHLQNGSMTKVATTNGAAILPGGPRTALVESHTPIELIELMKLSIPESGLSQANFLSQMEQILHYSVNTWDSGFMSKLYSSTDAPGLAAELLLATLNTQVHTFEVSPALTIIEKHTTRALAALFGLDGPNAGGISVQGGAASNTTSIVIARNTLHPSTKSHGSTGGMGLKLLILTSAAGHYSIEKAAQMLGFGSNSVWSVPVDPATQQMSIPALVSLLARAREQDYTPFYLNATAGTTVFGAYDPLPELASICRQHGLWLHVDASWGGGAIFSPTHRAKLTGSALADSIAFNPHKMLGVPVTCSFLLGADMRQFRASNTLPATYLFHQDPAADVAADAIFDLADLTLQCGRKGDALKMYLSWAWHGTAGFAAQIDAAFDAAAYLASLVDNHRDLLLVGHRPLPCCQICFYYAPAGRVKEEKTENERVTRTVVRGLVGRGIMIDFASSSADERGPFMRPVATRGTGREMMERLVEGVLELGEACWEG